MLELEILFIFTNAKVRNIRTGIINYFKHNIH